MRRALTHRLAAVAIAGWGAAGAFADDPSKRSSPETAPKWETTLSVPRPLDAGSDQVLGYLAYPKVNDTIQSIEAIAQSFAPPGALPPGQIKQMIGIAFGDPGLAKLDGTKPVVAMIFKPADPASEPPYGVYVPVRDPAPYEDRLGKMGLHVKTVDGILMGFNTEEALAAAERLLPCYRRIETAGMRSDVRAYVHVARALNVYEGLIRTGVDGFLDLLSAAAPAAPGAGGVGILKLEAHAALAILGQIDEVQIDVDVRGKAFGGNAIVTAKAGSALADLFNAPPPGPHRALGLLSQHGFLTGAFHFDSKAMARLSKQLMDVLAKDPDAAKLLTPDVRDIIGDLAAASFDQGAMSVRAAPGAPFLVETAMAVPDEAKALALAEHSTALMGPDGPLNKLYEDMGMPLRVKASMEKAARRHAGVDVHRLKIEFDADKLPDAQAAQIKALMKDQEFAFAKGWYLASQDSKSLDGMVDRALAGGSKDAAALQAAKAFGEGRNLYVDYDFIGLMKAVLEMMPQGQPGMPPKAALARLRAGDPMVFAATFAGGRAQMHGQIPLAPLVRLAKAAMGTDADEGGAPEDH